MIMPAMVILAILAIYPFLFGLWLSVQKWEMGDVAQSRIFVWFHNYGKALSSPAFWSSLLTTVIYTVFVVSLEFILGLGIAVLLNRNITGRSAIRSLVIIPLSVTPVVVGLVWRVMYNTEYGIINIYLNMIGLPTGKWIAGMSTALLSVMIVDIWQWTPFAALILLAGLQAIPDFLYEASQIDGASNLQQFRYITLQSLRSSILIVLLFRTIDSFKIFDNIYTLTMGGPGSATEILSLHIYIQGFRNRHMGYASAMATILLMIITLISQFYIRLVNRKETDLEKVKR